MFCPKCASQNIDGASFCRSCGANLSLVPQALGGQHPQTTTDDHDEDRWGRRGRRRELSLESALRNAFMGVAFLIVAIALSTSRMGAGWWFWMLIPAFSMMATGLAQYVRIKEREKRSLQGRGLPSQQFQPPPQAFPARNTGELVAPPPSVTEGTTRHLGAEAPTRHFGASSDVPK